MSDTLPNPPLKEVMVEVRWELEPSPINIPMDRGFELGVGAFWSSIRDEFTHHTRKAVGRSMEPYAIVHQFKRKEDNSLVIQLGHGIFTLSHTHVNYSWEHSFMPLFRKLFGLIPDAYRRPLNFNRCLLRYTDAISILPVNGVSPDMIQHLNGLMHVQMQNTIGEPYIPSNFTVDNQFKLDDMNIVLSISTGTQELENGESEPALIWRTTCMTKPGLLTLSQIESWLTSAHDRQTDLFTKLCKPELANVFRSPQA